jgi:hypothetical protein
MFGQVSKRFLFMTDPRLVRGELSIDHEGDLRLELPPDVGLPTPDQSVAKGEALDRIERE